MKASIRRIFTVAMVLCAFMMAAPCAEAAGQSKMIKLWLEAEVEDGADTTWKFYLYGAESEGSGQMTCTYGSKKYEGNWQTSSDGSRTAYVLSFLSNETPVFNAHDGNAVALTSSAIVMTGDLEGDFVIYTLGGQAVPFGSGGAARQVYSCELLD